MWCSAFSHVGAIWIASNIFHLIFSFGIGWEFFLVNERGFSLGKKTFTSRPFGNCSSVLIYYTISIIFIFFDFKAETGLIKIEPRYLETKPNWKFGCVCDFWIFKSKIYGSDFTQKPNQTYPCSPLNICIFIKKKYTYLYLK